MGSSFNGATTFQPWKPHQTRICIPTATSLQWGHDLSAVETVAVEAQIGRECHASMGPRPFSRGNGTDPRLARDEQVGFNGATTFQPWKLVEASTGIRATCVLQWGHDLSAVETPTMKRRIGRNAKLQWGHDLSAVETPPQPIQCQRVPPASMGPRPFSRGNS